MSGMSMHLHLNKSCWIFHLRLNAIMNERICIFKNNFKQLHLHWNMLAGIWTHVYYTRLWICMWLNYQLHVQVLFRCMLSFWLATKKSSARQKTPEWSAPLAQRTSPMGTSGKWRLFFGCHYVYLFLLPVRVVYLDLAKFKKFVIQSNSPQVANRHERHWRIKSATIIDVVRRGYGGHGKQPI